MVKKVQKKNGLAEFGGFDAGNELLRRFGGNPSKNHRNCCLGGDFLGQNIFFEIFDFSKNHRRTKIRMHFFRSLSWTEKTCTHHRMDPLKAPNLFFLKTFGNFSFGPKSRLQGIFFDIFFAGSQISSGSCFRGQKLQIRQFFYFLKIVGRGSF